MGAGLNLRYLGSVTPCLPNDCNGGQLARDVDASYKLDLVGCYTLESSAGSTSLSAGINNLLDSTPSLLYIGFGADDRDGASTYVGRFFYARLSHRF